MGRSVAVRHTFETGHRLPHLGGKCQNLHGHSWQVKVSLAGQLDERGIITEFAGVKQALRGWIDEHLDHGLMLGVADPLAEILRPHGKVFRFGVPDDDTAGDEFYATDLPWPTVELVAELLGRVTQTILGMVAPATRVARVRVQETSVNAAEWAPDYATAASVGTVAAGGPGIIVHTGPPAASGGALDAVVNARHMLLRGERP